MSWKKFTKILKSGGVKRSMVLKNTIGCLLIIWILMLVPQDAMAGCAAGTALYFKFKGETYLLLYIPEKYLPPDAQTNGLFEPFVTSLRAAKKADILP
jgi:hypothetical protein